MMMMSLKIIAGGYKGRTVSTVTSNAVRPTSGRVRQSILDTLSTELYHATVLDGFAGSGIMGFECLSRGAKHVLAVEKELNHAKKIQTNCQQLGIHPAAYQLRHRLLEQVLKGNNPYNEPFSLVYLDPPYGFTHWQTVLKHLLQSHWVTANTAILLEHGRTEPILTHWLQAHTTNEPTHPLQPTIERTLHYGDTTITWLRVPATVTTA
jgi:16S rRNA (guanine966-N2)-methyltransferase